MRAPANASGISPGTIACTPPQSVTWPAANSMFRLRSEMSSLPLASTNERWVGRAVREPVLILAFTVALAAQPQSHPATGKAIFEGKGACLRCHSIENRGGSLGPDLSGIGLLRTPQSLRQSVTDPNAEISDEYLTVVVVTSQGKQVEGIALNADDISIQLRDAQGNLRSFLRDN